METGTGPVDRIDLAPQAQACLRTRQAAASSNPAMATITGHH
jgi:hypothetical protein